MCVNTIMRCGCLSEYTPEKRKSFVVHAVSRATFHVPQLFQVTQLILRLLLILSWWRGTVVERRSLTGELSLSCARPAADG